MRKSEIDELLQEAGFDTSPAAVAPRREPDLDSIKTYIRALADHQTRTCANVKRAFAKLTVTQRHEYIVLIGRQAKLVADVFADELEPDKQEDLTVALVSIGTKAMREDVKAEDEIPLLEALKGSGLSVTMVRQLFGAAVSVEELQVGGLLDCPMEPGPAPPLYRHAAPHSGGAATFLLFCYQLVVDNTPPKRLLYP